MSLFTPTVERLWGCFVWNKRDDLESHNPRVDELNAAMVKHLYAIKRLQATSGTWYWGVNFSRNGERYSQRFYDPKHHGSANALKAAIAWRNKNLAEIKVMTVLEFCQKKRSNNRSSVPGVHFLTSAAQPNGVWQSKLKLADGTCKTKSFSVLKHGTREAFKLAVAARIEMLNSAADRPYLYAKTAKEFATRQRRGASS